MPDGDKSGVLFLTSNPTQLSLKISPKIRRNPFLHKRAIVSELSAGEFYGCLRSQQDDRKVCCRAGVLASEKWRHIKDRILLSVSTTRLAWSWKARVCFSGYSSSLHWRGYARIRICQPRHHQISNARLISVCRNFSKIFVRTSCGRLKALHLADGRRRSSVAQKQILDSCQFISVFYCGMPLEKPTAPKGKTFTRGTARYRWLVRITRSEQRTRFRGHNAI
jgi:hypothetical protein